MMHGGGGGQVHKDRRDWYNLKSMLPFLWEFRGRALFALACLVLSKIANVGVPIVLKEIVDHFQRVGTDPVALAAATPLALLGAWALLRQKPAWGLMLTGWWGATTLFIFLIRYSRATFTLI